MKRSGLKTQKIERKDGFEETIHKINLKQVDLEFMDTLNQACNYVLNRSYKHLWRKTYNYLLQFGKDHKITSVEIDNNTLTIKGHREKCHH